HRHDHRNQTIRLHGASFNTLAQRIVDFQDWYNTTSRPFNWTWNRDQLNDYLNRLARRTGVGSVMKTPGQIWSRNKSP
ncbi:hypothetical protein, partial [Brooklawnia sp.]|uniref:hypothetical protein n=1 Tax=Brooklawnia sp. TaxID=2699740 RepID=UPI0031203022